MHRKEFLKIASGAGICCGSAFLASMDASRAGQGAAPVSPCDKKVIQGQTCRFTVSFKA